MDEDQNFAVKFKISVVIPHLNQPEHLHRCLAALSAGKRLAEHVIVVDNGSKEMPHDICAAFPGTVLLRETKPGPGMARNAGVAAATGDVLAFIDADCRADPNWLAAAETALQDSDAMILGGDVRIDCVDPERLTLTEAYESIYAYRMDRYIAEQGFTGTGNLVVRRAVLEDVGPFAGIGVAEDIDWGKRATSKGYRIHYIQTMIVFHPARAHLDELRIKWDRHIAHFWHDTSKSQISKMRWWIKSGLMILSPFVEIPRIIASNRIRGARSRVLAFCGLFCIRSYRALRMVLVAIRGDSASLAGRWNRGDVRDDREM